MCALTFQDPEVRMSTCEWPTVTWEWQKQARLAGAGQGQDQGSWGLVRHQREAWDGDCKKKEASLSWPGVETRWKGRSLSQGSDPEDPSRTKNRCETEAVNVRGDTGSALKEMTPSKMHCCWRVLTGIGTQQLKLDSHKHGELPRAHKTLCPSKWTGKGTHPVLSSLEEWPFP